MILSLLSLIGGFLGHNLVNLFFNLNVQWTLMDYVEKGVIYGVSILVAYVFYQFAYKKMTILPTIRIIELTFNELVYSILLFFAGLLGYLMIVVK